MLGYNIFLLIFGFICLYLGAEGLVRGSSNFATKLGIRKAIIGATVVAWGTSFPEFIVSTVASIDKVSSIAIGNVIGSNIFNIAVIIGFSTLFYTLEIDEKLRKQEYPIMLFATLLLLVFVLNGEISRIEGFIYLIFFILFTLYYMKFADVKEQELPSNKELDRTAKGYAIDWILIIFGVINLFYGAKFLVSSSVYLARLLHISERIIAIIIVSTGTSLPELATSFVGALKGEYEISLGNIIGSNIFNLFLVLGAASAIRPIPTPLKNIYIDLIFLMIFSFGLYPILKFAKKGINRKIGLLLLFIYAIFVIILLKRRI